MINLRRKVKVEDQKQLNVLIITLKVLCFPWCCFFLSTRGKQVTFFATIHKQSQDHQLLDFPARCTLHAARCTLCAFSMRSLWFVYSRCLRPLQYFFITRRDDFCLRCWVRSKPRLTDGLSLIPCRRGFSWSSHYLHYWQGLFFRSGFGWRGFQR